MRNKDEFIAIKKKDKQIICKRRIEEAIFS